MKQFTINIKPNTKNKKIVIEIDADKFEKLAGDFGFFNPDFLKSLNRAEKDYKTGRIKKVSSLRELRN